MNLCGMIAEPHQVQNWTSIKEVWVLVLGFFVFLSAVSTAFSLVLDPRDATGKEGWECL